mgnify:CR=1 FL=1
MSILDKISGFGASMANARRERNAIRTIRSLPPELQRDIGWPTQENDGNRSMRSIMASMGR